MAGLLRGAFCPGCYRLLYSVTRDGPDDDWVQKDLPLQRDGDGPFVTCRSCRRQVRLRESGELRPGWGLEVDR